MTLAAEFGLTGFVSFHIKFFSDVFVTEKL